MNNVTNLDKRNIKRNLYTGLIYQFCNLIFGFILRKYIVRYLGVYNMGVNGVFENAMSILSLLNFGIGSSCTYYLYKAFSNKDYDEFASIYKYFKKMYLYVSLGIFVTGIIVMLNIQLIIQVNSENRNYLQLLFLIYLIKTSFSYISFCPRISLQCFGKRYYTSFADTIFLVLSFFFKIYFLAKTQSFVLYLIISFIETIFSYLYIRFAFNKEFKNIDFVNAKEDVKLNKKIIDYSKSLAVSNVNYFIYSSTDNLVLSRICGTIIVGYMSNYYLIINSVNGFIAQIINSIEAKWIKLYNLSTTNYKELYKISMFFTYAIALFTGTCLYCLTDDFIKVVFGKEFVMNKEIIILMTAIFIVGILRNSSNKVIVARKLVGKELPFIIAMAITNIVLSIILATMLGPKGVLIGTIVSEIILYAGDEWLTFNNVIKIDINIILKKMYYYLSIIFIIIITKKCMIPVVSYADLLVNFAICVLFVTVSLVILCRTNEFKEIFNIILPVKKHSK